MNVTYDKNNIYINGKKEKIVSGAIHYFRVVPEYWKDRLLKLKECGCNCVETYICWNLHEKKEGEFDFSGWLDFGRFIDIAHELGLYTIVRPGPYICSEWDFGGMPWWLLTYPDIKLRCYDELFLKLITPYLERVCDIIRPRLISNGGNVIFIQVENEYGSYGNDKKYLNWLKAFYEKEGMDCGILTSDGELDFMLNNGTLPDVFACVNYRTESEYCIGLLRDHHVNQPGAVMELWNGRQMHWGTAFERRDVEEVKESVDSALQYAEMVNLYMFHGGTTFGFMNGSLDFGEELNVQMTSYDVDAPLDEYGRRTPKYYAEQEVICRHLGKEIVNTATDTVLASYEHIEFVGECSLKDSGLILSCTHSPTVKTMEQCGQGYGYIIYDTPVFVGSTGTMLILPKVHDIAHVYIDGEYVKTILRHDKAKEVAINKSGVCRVSIVVENMGRVNYGVRLKDYKGLVGDIVVHDQIPFQFDIYSLPLDHLPDRYDGVALVNEPAFYKYECEH